MVGILTYSEPSTLESLLSLLKTRGDLSLLGGGTDLLVKANKGITSPRNLISLKSVEEMQNFQLEKDKIIIGSMVTLDRLTRSILLREKALCLAEAAGEIGSPQIRHRGTIGGNIANASPAADTVPPLMALNSKVKLVSTEGEKQIALEDFFSGPGKTILGQGQVIKEIIIPTPKNNQGSAFLKLGKRNALAISLVNVSAVVAADIQAMSIIEARIALGAAAPTVVLADAAAEKLKGREISEALLESAAEAVWQDIQPITDIRTSAEYRREMSKVITKRALIKAINRAFGRKLL